MIGAATCRTGATTRRVGTAARPTGAAARRISTLACCTAGFGLLPLVACDDSEPTWTLAWEDEFEGPAGTLPDPGRWTFDIGTDWGNAQLEWDTDSPNNVSLDGTGNLAITARRENYGDNEYTSGRIKTQGLFAQNGGRFEARIKMPSGQGIWPAFWLLGTGIDSIGWPDCGEIDVVEFRGQEPSVIHGSIHGPGYSGASAMTTRYVLDEGGFDQDFHTFRVDWTEDTIEWYVDDLIYQRIRRADVPGEWAFDDSFFILLNVAVGGGFVGPPNASTVFPQSMLVDWVRVYRQS